MRAFQMTTKDLTSETIPLKEDILLKSFRLINKVISP
jgi:hypothetical protein